MSRQRDTETPRADRRRSGHREGRPAVPRATASSPRRVITADEAAVVSFLGEVLIGENRWNLGEVRRLLELRDLEARGQWRLTGIDDAGAEQA